MKRRFPLDTTARSRLLAGFTLVEILVATAILSILALLLANVLGLITNLSSQAAGRLDAVRLGREIFDLFERDFFQVVTTRPALGASVPLQFWVNPTQVGSAYKNPAAVFWQSGISRDRTAGNVAVVGYFVQKPAANRSQLRRVLIEPADPLYKISIDPATYLPADWLPSTTVDVFAATAGSDSSSQLDRGWVADGVLALWVRCLDANGELITKDGTDTTRNDSFDSRLGYRSGPTGSGFVYATFNAIPAFVEIGIVCVAPQDAERIDSLPAAVATEPPPSDLRTDMDAYVSTFASQNKRVKTATALTRRFRLYGTN